MKDRLESARVRVYMGVSVYVCVKQTVCLILGERGYVYEKKTF